MDLSYLDYDIIPSALYVYGSHISVNSKGSARKKKVTIFFQDLQERRVTIL